MKNKIMEHHSDSNWIKAFSRYTLISHIIDSDSWSEMEDKLKKRDSKNYQKDLSLLFNEFKFYNIILNVEYYITDFLNDFLIKKEREICIVAIHPKLKNPYHILGQCEISNLEWDAATHVGKLGIIVQTKFRDLGIGFNLIDEAIRESKKLNNKEKIILSCFSNNKRALYLYKKMGFQIIGIRKKQFYMDSKYYDEILLDLWIDDYLANNP